MEISPTTAHSPATRVGSLRSRHRPCDTHDDPGSWAGDVHGGRLSRLGDDQVGLRAGIPSHDRIPCGLSQDLSAMSTRFATGSTQQVGIPAKFPLPRAQAAYQASRLPHLATERSRRTVDSRQAIASAMTQHEGAQCQVKARAKWSKAKWILLLSVNLVSS